jgi:hypothetical protein
VLLVGREVFPDRTQDHVQVDGEILMDEDVAHPRHVLLSHLGILLPELCVELLCGLPDNLEGPL